MRVLGRGGMGTVYLAERADGEVIQRAAIKLLRYAGDDSCRLERFLREHQILALIVPRNGVCGRGARRRICVPIAGRRCADLGLSELSRALDAHAHQEADHHLLMQADTHRPVERWNENHEPQRNAAELLALAPTPGAPGASRAGVDFWAHSSSRPIPVTGPWIRPHLPATRQCETSGHFFSSSAAHLVVLSVWHVVQGLGILN